jgi:hypothetical protein
MVFDETDLNSENIDSLRERNKFHERLWFTDETTEDSGTKRRKVTPERKERMDRDLERLGDLFDGTSVRWQLDGAVNISLMKGEYIGAHKDLDLTVDPDDLQELERHLFSKGYGLFLSRITKMKPSGGPEAMQWEWATVDELRATPENIMIVAIDKEGNLRENEPLNCIDLHLIKRGPNGEPLGFYGVALPEKWFVPRPIEFNGRKINLSHPAKVAYFKLFSARQYDAKDLEELAETGSLSEEDMRDIKAAVDGGFENRRMGAEIIINRIVGKISNEMQENEILAVFLNDQEASRATETERGRAMLQKVAVAIAKQKDRTPENIKNIIFDVLDWDSEEDRMQKQIQSLHKIISK